MTRQQYITKMQVQSKCMEAESRVNTLTDELFKVADDSQYNNIVDKLAKAIHDRVVWHKVLKGLPY